MKRTIWNFRWIFFEFIFLLVTILGAANWDEDPWLSAAMVIAGLFFLMGYAVVIPHRYTFSDEGITVRYCFPISTFLRWKDIKHIEDHYAGVRLFPWLRQYEIGYFPTKFPFHQRAMLPKNRKITELLQQYYHKKIERIG